MHDIDIVTIWFYSVSAGVLLTLLMTQLAAAPGRNNAETVQLAQDASDEQLDMLVRTEHEPALTLASTSWTWGLPRAVPDHRARDHDQAA